MKTTALLFLMLFAALITGTSCFNSTFGGEKGSGKIAIDNRNIPAFKGIEMATCANVILTQGPQSVRIEGDDNIVPHITTEIKGDILVINSKGNFSTKAPLNVYISIPEISSAAVSGSGDIKAENNIHSDVLTLTVSGSGSIKLDVDAKAVSSKVTGSGTITLSGKTDEHISKISGSGDVLATKLETRKTEIRITGSGTCKVDAKDILTVDISGSGDVYYVGKPEKVDSHISGSGDVRQIN